MLDPSHKIKFWHCDFHDFAMYQDIKAMVYLAFEFVNFKTYLLLFIFYFKKIK